MTKLLAILTFAFSLCFATAKDHADIIYPLKLTDKQKSTLDSLSSWKWYTPITSKKTKNTHPQSSPEWKNLLTSLSNLKLPNLGSVEEIRVTKDKITNTAKKDRLVVIAHETGGDIANRTHWLKAGESIPNKSIYMEGLPCHILSPANK